MTYKLIEGDMHYGQIGFGSVSEVTTQVFGVARLPEIAEPTIVIKQASKKKLSLIPSDIQDFIVLDNMQWLPYTQNLATFTTLADDQASLVGGITKDNSRDGDQSPTADTVAQGTRPSGDGALTVGGAGGQGVTQAVMLAENIGLRFEARWQFLAFTDEQQDATGQIPVQSFQSLPKVIPEVKPYRVEGFDAFNLMTAAHYHAWIKGDNVTGVSQQNIGARVRKCAIDFNEILFDRDILASLLDILTFTP